MTARGECGLRVRAAAIAVAGAMMLTLAACTANRYADSGADSESDPAQVFEPMEYQSPEGVLGQGAWPGPAWLGNRVASGNLIVDARTGEAEAILANPRTRRARNPRRS